jgi:ABC-2 type transport system ATP-binding protein
MQVRREVIQMSEYAIVTEGLTKIYEDRKAVDNLNLQVPRESVFAFLGPNGAGKTTTIKLLLGLIKPSLGTLEILGEKMGTGIGNSCYLEKIGYIPDNPEFYGYMNFNDLVSFCRPLYSRWDDKLVKKVCQVMDIPVKVKTKHLSRGQKAAVALALALAPRPELLILDEPATQFDPIKKKTYYSLLFEEMVGEGGAVFLATHQLNEVERFADYAAFMRNGRLLLVRPVDELKVSEKRIRVVFQGEEPAGLADWPEIRRVDRQGKSIFLTVGENFEEVWAKVSKFPHFALELIDMDLEDIFIEYAGEGRSNR